MKTIFLDFDGVLHGEGKNSNQFFEHIDLFCNFIREYKNEVQVVISSSWREEKTLAELKNIFHEDVQCMIVGVTPQLPIEERYAKGGREKEVLLYCRENNINNWIALDDQTRFFSDDCKNLILINGETGLSIEDLSRIELFIINEKKKLKI